MKPLRKATFQKPDQSIAEQIINMTAHIQKVTNKAGIEMSAGEAQEQAIETLFTEVWVNDEYQVCVRRNEHFAHLSIKHLDKKPARDWRAFQQIKNQIIGPENEGVELYPSESRLVDTANQYHLWVAIDPEYKFPFGFNNGRVVQYESGFGVVQRPPG